MPDGGWETAPAAATAKTFPTDACLSATAGAMNKLSFPRPHLRDRRIFLGHVMASLCVSILAACQTTQNTVPQRHTVDEASFSVTPSSDILIVYISAGNCPPCWRFKARDYPVWIKSEEYRHVEFRELNFPQYQRTDEDIYWPGDLRWIREKTDARRGAPRWIVVVDGRVVANERSWNRKTYPLIQRLVARKLDA